MRVLELQKTALRQSYATHWKRLVYGQGMLLAVLYVLLGSWWVISALHVTTTGITTTCQGFVLGAFGLGLDLSRVCELLVSGAYVSAAVVVIGLVLFILPRMDRLLPLTVICFIISLFASRQVVSALALLSLLLVEHLWFLLLRSFALKAVAKRVSQRVGETVGGDRGIGPKSRSSTRSRADSASGSINRSTLAQGEVGAGGDLASEQSFLDECSADLWLEVMMLIMDIVFLFLTLFLFIWFYSNPGQRSTCASVWLWPQFVDHAFIPMSRAHLQTLDADLELTCDVVTQLARVLVGAM